MARDGGLLDVVRCGQVGFAEVQAQHSIHRHGDLRQLANTRVGHFFAERARRGIRDILSLAGQTCRAPRSVVIHEHSIPFEVSWLESPQRIKER